jgi:hypothetical protein
MDENPYLLMEVKHEKHLTAAIDLLQNQHWDILQIYKQEKKPVIQAWQKLPGKRVKLVKIVLPANYSLLVMTKKISFTQDGEVYIRKMKLRLDYYRYRSGAIGLRIIIHQTRRQKPPGVNRK